MKKLISMLLALAMCLMGLALAEAMDVTGDWYLNAIEAEGVQMDPALLGLDMSITLNADGTAALSSFGNGADMGTWSISGSILAITDSVGDTMIAELIGNELVIDETETIGGSMILGREKQAPQGYVPAAVESAPALQDFEGTWTASLIDMLGMQMAMDKIGMKLVLEIEGDKATVTSNESGADVSYEAPLTLQGDTLNVAAVEDQMPLHLQLQQDGKLVYAEEEEGMAVYIYFEKTV